MDSTLFYFSPMNTERSNKYLVTIYLNELDEEFWKVLQSHRQLINKLLLENIIESYAVNLERSRVWIVLNAESESAASDLIDTFPIRQYFSYETDQLLFFQNAPGLFAKLVLN